MHAHADHTLLVNICGISCDVHFEQQHSIQSARAFAHLSKSVTAWLSGQACLGNSDPTLGQSLKFLLWHLVKQHARPC